MQELLQTVVGIIDNLHKEKTSILLAIDGRCASGKTTLAGMLQQHYHCEVIHMDHFFLRKEQRTKERLSTPGENVDYERFEEEVMKPLQAGERVVYRPYNCQLQELTKPVELARSPIIIVEGSYSCHRVLWDYYDLRIFLDVSHAEQLRRISWRAGREKAEVFREKWIPLEEGYFEEYHLRERCDYCFTT